jgi:hypothetical protein
MGVGLGECDQCKQSCETAHGDPLSFYRAV